MLDTEGGGDIGPLNALLLEQKVRQSALNARDQWTTARNKPRDSHARQTVLGTLRAAIASIHRDQPKTSRTGSAGQVRQSEIPLTLQTTAHSALQAT
jgi:hypothetical protein